MAEFNVNIVANLIDNVTRRAQQIRESLRGIGEEAEKIGDSSNKGLDKAAGGLNKFERNTKLIAGGIAASIVGIGVAATRARARFEQNFNKIASALDLPIEKTNELRESWEKLVAEIHGSRPESLERVTEAIQDAITVGGKNQKAVKELSQLFLNMDELGRGKNVQRWGQLANLFGKDLDVEGGRQWLKELMAAVNFLGKKANIDKESLLGFMSQRGAWLKGLGFDARQTAALGTLLQSDLGQTAGRGVQGLISSLERLRQLVYKGGKKADIVSQTLGFRDAEEMNEGLALSTGGFETLIRLIARLQQLGPGHREAFLSQLGVQAGQIRELLNPQNAKKLLEYYKLALDPEALDAMVRDWIRKHDDLYSLWDTLINKIHSKLATSGLGKLINEELKLFIKDLQNFIDDLGEWIDWIEDKFSPLTSIIQNVTNALNSFNRAVHEFGNNINKFFKNKWFNKDWWFSTPEGSHPNIRPQSFTDGGGPRNLLHRAFWRRELGGGAPGSRGGIVPAVWGGGGSFGGGGGLTPASFTPGSFGGLGGGGSFGGGSARVGPSESGGATSGGIVSPTSAPQMLGGAGQALTGAGTISSAVDMVEGLVGLHERANRTQINQFLRRGGVNIDAARTAWCAGFVNSALRQVGVTGTGSLVATSFMKWGKAVKPEDVQRGDVLVDHRGRRPGQTGGHVGFATGRKRMGPHGLELEMLSGNESNRVQKSWYRASRLAIRRSAQVADVVQQANAATKAMTGAAQTIGANPGDWPDFRGTRGPASIRNNNPGAMWPGPVAKEFGMTGWQQLSDRQRNKIATFPSMVHGGAALFGLLGGKGYMGKTIPQAIAKWSGGNHVASYLRNLQKQGVDIGQRITPEFLQDPNKAIALARAMSRHEAGRTSPMTDAHWQSAHQMFMQRRYPGLAQRSAMQQQRQQTTMTQGGQNVTAAAGGGTTVNAPVNVKLNVNRPQANVDQISQNVGHQVSEGVKRALNNSLNDGVTGYAQR